MVAGYQVLDQFFVSCFVLAAAFSAKGTYGASASENLPINDRLSGFHNLIFWLMIGYFIFESLRGMIVLESVEKLRWVAYYIAIAGVAYYSLKRKYFPLTLTAFSGAVAVSSIAYFGVYLAMVVQLEYFSAISRWIAQGEGWRGGAFAFFPVVVSMPASMALIQEKSGKYSGLGWFCLVFAMFVAFVSERRVAWIPSVIAVAFMFLRFLYAAKIKKTVYLLLGFLLPSLFAIILFSGHNLEEEARRYREEMVESFNVGTDAKDIDRQFHIEIAHKIISEDPKTFLFGFGLRAGEPHMVPYMAQYYRYYFPLISTSKIHAIEEVSTFGIPALIVDTGYIGVFLLSANLIVLCLRVFLRRNNETRSVILLSIMSMVAWLYANNVLIYILFFLAIMPNGVFMWLSVLGNSKGSAAIARA